MGKISESNTRKKVDYREQLSETWSVGTTVVPQLFREKLSEKKESIAEPSSRQSYVNCQLP